ncbi:NPCBM/NEW2 domain-containing protein [Actinosynnema sp. NPDC047251]|uniref:NPCBM/NEW2 domain-containing protein n=1 Tax=Saccharothrix espanaensis TaxID=103731 RepID=UPI00059C8306|nr:NPCBM/NEW2 domain-containing protein [Saccharothrix espanaensis]
MLKIIGAAVCLLIGVTVLTTTRARDRPPPRVLLSLTLAGGAALALVVVLASGHAPTEQATSQAAPGTPTTAADTIGSAKSIPNTAPGAISLVDVGPVRNDPAENLWTTGPVRLKGVPHDQAIAATGAWCGSNQIEYPLDGRFDRFTAFVGISDESAETKPLDFFALTDGNRVVDLAAVSNKAPQLVEIAVTGVARLVIGVKPPAGDPSNCPGPERVGVWADPLLIPVR